MEPVWVSDEDGAGRDWETSGGPSEVTLKIVRDNSYLPREYAEY